MKEMNFDMIVLPEMTNMTINDDGVLRFDVDPNQLNIHFEIKTEISLIEMLDCLNLAIKEYIGKTVDKTLEQDILNSAKSIMKKRGLCS